MPPIRLHYHPATRAIRARWVLEEVGLAHELLTVDLMAGAHRQEAYRAVNPLGKVPALEIDGTTLYESQAICLYLADRNPEAKLAPAPQDLPGRAAYYQWMAYAIATLEPAVLEQYRLHKAKEQNLVPVDIGPALTPFADAAGHIEQALAEHPYLLGDDFSAADILNGSILMWAHKMGSIAGFAQIEAWLQRLMARPAFQRMMAE